MNFSLDEYTQRNILFLKGVFKKDCTSIEDIFDNRITEESEFIAGNDAFINENKYDKIEKKFVNLKSWHSSVNIKCWSCCLQFDNVPVFIPTSIDQPSEESEYGEMDVLGVFCSFNCAVWYIERHCEEERKWEYKNMLKILFKIFKGKDINEIKPSKDRWCMVQYGGNMNPNEYREHIYNIDKEYEHFIKHSKIENISIV